MSISKVAVIGAGTMGNGIAHVFAQYGYPVVLIDISDDQLANALATIEKNLARQIKKGTIQESDKEKTLKNITTGNYIPGNVGEADLIVEAATENEALKLKIFKEVDASAKPGVILASNTSSISITKIASVTTRPERVIGMHFMNPVPMMKLVEVISGYHTDKSVVDEITELSKALDKVPCVVEDYPGFIANRILMPMINEAVYSLHEGVTGVEEIDTIMKLGMAHPMGPLQLADFIGLDVCCSILNVMYEGFRNPKYAPCPLLVNMVTAGNLGKKTGKGFYDYTGGGKELVVNSIFKK
ncbi:MAG: 3-hydroxybutyryl-CoA dehydrogenase [Chitinophagaceae bacterium]|nr:3-hydroxybutyryl-CoA dehydrogenase [Chitinophagaceae bacterium]